MNQYIWLGQCVAGREGEREKELRATQECGVPWCVWDAWRGFRGVIHLLSPAKVEQFEQCTILLLLCCLALRPYCYVGELGPSNN